MTDAAAPRILRAMIRLTAPFALLPALALLACSAPSPLAPPPATPPAAAEPALPKASGPVAPAAATGKPAEPACEPLAVELPEIARGPEDPAPVPLEDLGAGTLDAFYEHAAAVLRGRAKDHVRIGVYGDSNMTMDFITGRMRRVLQGRYGDAGHGFVAGGQPWSHYRHMDVVHGTRGSLQAYACSTTPTHDAEYGLPCIVAETALGGSSFFATAEPPAPIGRSVGRFDVFYLRRKGYGRFDVRVDGATRASLDSNAPADELGFEQVRVEDGPHRLELVGTSGDRVRFIGAALEREGKPSFVVDSFGVGAMNTEAQSRRSPTLNRAMYARRPYDLIVYMSGANDIFTLDRTPRLLGEMIDNDRQALPHAGILIVTPADRGSGVSFGPTVDAVKQRRTIAHDKATALWDLWLAMGGENSMGRFYRRGLSIEDAVHFNEAGGAWVGDRLLYALWEGLRGYVAAHPRAGCDAAG